MCLCVFVVVGVGDGLVAPVVKDAGGTHAHTHAHTPTHPPENQMRFMAWNMEMLASLMHNKVLAPQSHFPVPCPPQPYILPRHASSKSYGLGILTPIPPSQTLP